jgi:S-disulfanyl-L-cysteine oxidoreductase SoxD
MRSSTFTLLRAHVLGLVCVYLAGVAIFADAPRSLQAGASAAASVDGSYTQAQAKRGKQLSAEHCAACHGEDLSGEGLSPSLAGESFLALWEGRSVADLYELVRTTMPVQAPLSLTDVEYIEIVAFLLQANNVRAGERELKADAPDLKSLVLRRSASSH